ncbi:hypothetical protein GX586_14750 [bacterium]|nr:hypothetical protein [bacterium]
MNANGLHSTLAPDSFNERTDRLANCPQERPKVLAAVRNGFRGRHVACAFLLVDHAPAARADDLLHLPRRRRRAVAGPIAAGRAGSPFLKPTVGTHHPGKPLRRCLPGQTSQPAPTRVAAVRKPFTCNRVQINTVPLGTRKTIVKQDFHLVERAWSGHWAR